jgi:hypothetical protein
MRTNYSLFLPLFFLLACSKGKDEISQPCVPVAVYFDQYTIDTTYLRTVRWDTNCLSGYWLSIYNQGDRWELLCDSFGNGLKLERTRYLIGNQVSKIYFKK